MTDLKVPKFETEAEEAAWWEDHEEELALEFEKAVIDSHINPDGTALPFVSVDVDPEDIGKARIQAAELGLRYQTYLKMIIHEALRNAEKDKQSSSR